MVQLQALNYILKSKDSSFFVLNNLNEDYFSDFKDEFRAIKNHYDTYGNVMDIESFLSVFPKFELIEVTESPKYLIDELVKDKQTRKIIEAVNSFREPLLKGDTQKAIQIYLSGVEELTRSVNLESVDIFKDAKARYDAFEEKVMDFNRFYVTTGFPELDEVIGGWDRKEELATIIGRPGRGKSWLCLKVALAAAQAGLKVGLYSGEMSELKVGTRIDSLASGISNYKITKGKEDITSDYKHYIDSAVRGEVSKGTIKVITPSSINGPAGVTALRAFIEKERLDMLVIDQHSLLEDDRRGKTPVEKASNISRDLKNLQVMKKIPIIAVSQQNRTKPEDGEDVDVANIAQSDRIGQDSTAVIAVDQKDGIMTLTLVKSRDSVTGKKLKYAVNLDTGLFEFQPEGDDATGGAHTEALKNEYVDISEQEIY